MLSVPPTNTVPLSRHDRRLLQLLVKNPPPTHVPDTMVVQMSSTDASPPDTLVMLFTQRAGERSFIWAARAATASCERFGEAWTTLIDLAQHGSSMAVDFAGRPPTGDTYGAPNVTIRAMDPLSGVPSILAATYYDRVTGLVREVVASATESRAVQHAWDCLHSLLMRAEVIEEHVVTDKPRRPTKPPTRRPKKKRSRRRRKRR